jgi:hypothetical protein
MHPITQTIGDDIVIHDPSLTNGTCQLPDTNSTDSSSENPVCSHLLYFCILLFLNHLFQRDHNHANVQIAFAITCTSCAVYCVSLVSFEIKQREGNTDEVVFDMDRFLVVVILCCKCGPLHHFCFRKQISLKHNIKI